MSFTVLPFGSFVSNTSRYAPTGRGISPCHFSAAAWVISRDATSSPTSQVFQSHGPFSSLPYPYRPLPAGFLTGRSGATRRNALSVPLTGIGAPAREFTVTRTGTPFSGVCHEPSAQTLARHWTVPISNDSAAPRSSPVSSVTCAVTVNSNDGSPERSAVGEATGVNVTLKTPFSSVSASPSPTKFSPSSSLSSQNQRHQPG